MKANSWLAFKGVRFGTDVTSLLSLFGSKLESDIAVPRYKIALYAWAWKSASFPDTIKLAERGSAAFIDLKGHVTAPWQHHIIFCAFMAFLLCVTQNLLTRIGSKGQWQ